MRTTTASNQNSILGTCVKAIGRALDAAGCDGAALLAEAGFDLKELDGPDTRCPLTKTAHLWRLALAATGDPAFGLKLTKQYKHTMFHALGYGLSASSTLKEAFERVQRFSHVVSDAVEYQFFCCGSEYHFILEPVTDVPVESIDALVGMYLQLCRSLIGREFSPLSIELQRPRPAVVDDFQRLGAPRCSSAPSKTGLFSTGTASSGCSIAAIRNSRDSATRSRLNISRGSSAIISKRAYAKS